MFHWIPRPQRIWRLSYQDFPPLCCPMIGFCTKISLRIGLWLIFMLTLIFLSQKIRGLRFQREHHLPLFHKLHHFHFQTHVPVIALSVSPGKMVQLLPDLMDYLNIVTHSLWSGIGANYQWRFLTWAEAMWHAVWSLEFTMVNSSHPTSCRELG